jgi:hypothetical protein
VATVAVGLLRRVVEKNDARRERDVDSGIGQGSLDGAHGIAARVHNIGAFRLAPPARMDVDSRTASSHGIASGAGSRPMPSTSRKAARMTSQALSTSSPYPMPTSYSLRRMEKAVLTVTIWVYTSLLG